MAKKNDCTPDEGSWGPTSSEVLSKMPLTKPITTNDKECYIEGDMHNSGAMKGAVNALNSLRKDRSYK